MAFKKGESANPGGRKAIGLSREVRASEGLKTWAKLFFAIYILITIPLLAYLLFLMVRAAPRVLATAWGALGHQVTLLPDAFGAEVRVLCAKVGGALQSRCGELVQRVGGELGLDLPGAIAGVVVTGAVAGSSVARGSVRSAVSHESQPIPRPGRRIGRRHPG